MGLKVPGVDWDPFAGIIGDNDKAFTFPTYTVRAGNMCEWEEAGNREANLLPPPPLLSADLLHSHSGNPSHPCQTHGRAAGVPLSCLRRWQMFLAKNQTQFLFLLFSAPEHRAEHQRASNVRKLGGVQHPHR